MNRLSMVSAGVVLFVAPWGTQGEEINVADVPPVVVRTVPEAGTTEIDPALNEIRVTFSKDMRDGNWSWAQRSTETFPEVNGKLRYEKDKRTAVLPVKLTPGHTYILEINSQKFKNFKDADGRPAVPYLLVFQTKSAP